VSPTLIWGAKTFQPPPRTILGVTMNLIQTLEQEEIARLNKTIPKAS
jgi:hypothetical protein